MPPDTFSPSLPITPTESWTQDSTLDDVQQEQSEGPEGVIVFEKKWIATDTEDGDDTVSFPADTRPTSISHSLSNDAIAAFQFQDGIVDKNGIFFDPNIDSSSEMTEEWEDESPYPEVRAAVSNTDDMEMPAETLRAWILGLLWAFFIPGLNQFFHFRYPSVTIGSLVAQLLSFPLGCAWARTVPGYRIFGVSLNPGPFSLKEHVLITVMATVGSSSAYATEIIAVQRKHYGHDWSFAYQWLLVMSTQLIGFSMGGVAKRFLVSPPSMIWPANLVTCALFNTLHSQVYPGFRDKGMSRERFFLYGFLASFVWYFFPGYLFTALSTFSWVTWIWPRNIVRDTRCSSRTSQLKCFYRPSINSSDIVLALACPSLLSIGTTSPSSGAHLQRLIPARKAYLVLKYTNAWYSMFTPMMSSHMFDNTGQYYNVSRILTPQSTLDEGAYQQYSPLFLSASFAMSYGLSFATITATLVHSALYFRKQIWLQIGRSLSEQPDVHARLMARYPQVPEWWYLSILVVVFAISAVTVEVWPTEVPIWALLTALSISAFYIVPAGMIQAITNQQIGLNVITELVVGYALPGRPVAMMIFKTFGYITMAQALQFTSDMKLGHYMKVPPRTMFLCQIVATVVAGTTQLGVQQWMFAHISDFCDTQQSDHFICPSTEVFFVASVVWGLTYFFLMGALAPLAGWLINKRWPTSFFKYVNVPVVLAGTAQIPPATAVNFIPWALIGFIFNFVIRRRHFNWWAKYNYVLSAALDTGTAVGTLLVFFALQYPNRGTMGASTIEKWWGNTVYMETADQKALPLRKSGPVLPANVVTMPPSTTASEMLPSSVFESLLPKLLTILQVTQRPEGTSNVRNKQDLLQAIQAFRETLNDARSIANALPGGEMLIEEQEEVIAMLERLRAKKRLQLRDFSEKVIDTKAAGYTVPAQYQYASGIGGAGIGGAAIIGVGAGAGVGGVAGSSDAQMEVDSNASTPA
ncbi:OPT oligopeptide transporter protein-domain-containing protein [Russula aff. rugulosa BPL654]|nr:OPT oligopeptide transporter protein-domain-containing protein [Russula aff. rugulosa BPL654]